MSPMARRSRRDNNVVQSGGDGAWVFVETCRDRLANDVPPAAPGLVERDVVHEIGHQCGLDDLAGGIMAGRLQNAPPVLGFIPSHLNLLRCRVRSPGQ